MGSINMTSYDGETNAKEIVDALKHSIEGKTFMITGASKGSLGAEVALTLAAAKPKEFIFVGRNKSKVEAVMADVAAIEKSIKTTFVAGDMCDNATMKKAGAEIAAMDVTIDSIICAAGTMAVREYTPSKDNIENQFAANFVGHFVLVNLVLGKMAKESTVVTVTSAGYEAAEVSFDDYNFGDGKTYNPWYAYGQATTAKILFAFGLSKKPGVAGFSVHPGYVPGTSLQANNGVDMDLLIEGFKIGTERNGGKPPPESPERTPQQGAATIILAAVDSKLRSAAPAYMHECSTKVAKDYATNEENQAKLWQLGNKLTGENFSL